MSLCRRGIINTVIAAGYIGVVGIAPWMLQVQHVSQFMRDGLGGVICIIVQADDTIIKWLVSKAAGEVSISCRAGICSAKRVDQPYVHIHIRRPLIEFSFIITAHRQVRLKTYNTLGRLAVRVNGSQVQPDLRIAYIGYKRCDNTRCIGILLHVYYSPVGSRFVQSVIAYIFYTVIMYHMHYKWYIVGSGIGACSSGTLGYLSFDLCLKLLFILRDLGILLY